MTRSILPLAWTVSRARDTYGYNVVTLTDSGNSKKYRTNGGGYDMVGTVFGQWMQDTQQDRLVELAQTARQSEPPSVGGRWVRVPGYYGMKYDREGANDGPVRVSLDSACGIESMVRIAEAAGLKVDRWCDRRGNTVGFIVEVAA